MTRREELNNIFKDVDENEKQLINKLLDEMIFLEDKMTELKKLPFLNINPKNQAQQKITPAAKLYKECSQSYMNAIRIGIGILNKIDSAEKDDLLKRLEQFNI